MLSVVILGCFLIELDKLFSYEAEFECDQEKLTNYLVHTYTLQITESKIPLIPFIS